MDVPETESPMTLSVIIPNYNGASLLPRFMPSVLRAVGNAPVPTEVLFVDDVSTDDSITIAKSFRELRIIQRDNNGGFSAACNTGIAEAGGDILFFLNTDVELSEDFFATFADYFVQEHTFAVTVRAYRYGTDEPLDGIKWGEWKRGNLRVTKNLFPDEGADTTQWYPSFGVQGAYFFADAEKVRLLGGFDELFSPYIFEETDLCYRAMMRGWKIYYDHRAVAFHQHSTTLRSTASQRKIKTIAQRNRLIFTWKNIHSFPLIFSHGCFHVLRLLGLNRTVWSATLEALRLLGIIRKKRREERSARTISDIAMLRSFHEWYNRLNLRS
jgi:GT2 family glycosyltransferase